jgi:hypothetical protein
MSEVVLETVFPKRERRPFVVLTYPLQGSWERLRFGVPFFMGSMNMVTQDEAKLIAEYERLRDKLFEVEALATAIDHRLVEIERLLPEEYSPPASGFKKLPKKPGSGDR